MKSHIKVHLKQPDPQAREVLLALLSGIGFEGFEEGHNYLNAYAEEGIADLEQLDAIASLQDISYEVESIAPQNWNESWEKNFHPVVVDDFCVIRADFHEPIPGVKHEVVITPKMSFGTGHHATTYMMLQGMSTSDFVGKSVLDFGTGTGVLAIMAKKLGAGFVRAIDNDEWSIENALENFERNGWSELSPEMADQLSDGRKYEVILANINKNVLLNSMNSIAQHLSENGMVWMSGLLQGDKEAILAAAEGAGLYEMGEGMTRQGWICIQLNKVKSSTT